jgi:SPP1 family predicted phage head-tail adaptor
MSAFYDRMIKLGSDSIDRFKNPIQATHERASYVVDSSGGRIETWSVLSEFDIAILPKSGSSSFVSNRTESDVSVIALAKYSDLSNFVDGDRITHDGRSYKVDAHFDIAKANSVIKLICDDGAAT